MLELLKIKQKLEGKRYTGINSLFELRLLLMDAASIITRTHISNFQQQKDVKVAASLLSSFNKIRNSFHVIETTKCDHEQCFFQIQSLVSADLSNLLFSSDLQEHKIIPLQNTSPATFGIAK
jgi:hypothetical protein